MLPKDIQRHTMSEWDSILFDTSRSDPDKIRQFSKLRTSTCVIYRVWVILEYFSDTFLRVSPQQEVLTVTHVQQAEVMTTMQHCFLFMADLVKNCFKI